MTTDLTGDFDLGEDELEWDVFVPDPDDAEIAAEAAALEDRDELDLDDSDFDWDSALREDPEEGAAESGARAGAAYDRIVDTVRRSFEEPEPEPEPELEPEPEPDAELVAASWVERVAAADSESEPEPEPEPDAELVTASWVERVAAADSELSAEQLAADELATAYGESEPEADLYRLADLELEEELELEEPAWTKEPDAAAAPEPEPETETETEPQAAALFVTATNAGPEVPSEREPEPEQAPEPTLEVEPAEARIATMAATVAAVQLPEEPPIEAFEPEPDIAPDAAAPWEGPGETTPAESVVPRRTRKSRARKQREQSERSRVFTATIVLACLVLVVIAAAALVYALHHPTTVAPTGHAPAHAAASASSSSDIRADSGGNRCPGLGHDLGQRGTVLASDLPHAIERREGRQLLHLVAPALRNAPVREHDPRSGSVRRVERRNAGAPGSAIPRHHRLAATSAARCLPEAVRHRCHPTADDPERTRAEPQGHRTLRPLRGVSEPSRATGQAAFRRDFPSGVPTSILWNRHH